MSAPELNEHRELEAKSSVKITCNAKGDAQPEVKIYEGCDPGEVERIRVIAVEAYLATQREVRGVSLEPIVGLAESVAP